MICKHKLEAKLHGTNSRAMRKRHEIFVYAKTKISNYTADQRLCFRCSDSTIPPLPIDSSETAQAGMCQTWSETPKTGFLASPLMNL